MFYMCCFVLVVALCSLQSVTGCHSVEHCFDVQCKRKRSLPSYNISQLLDEHNLAPKMHSCVDDYLKQTNTMEYGFIYTSKDTQKRKKRFVQQSPPPNYFHGSSLMYKLWNLAASWYRGSVLRQKALKRKKNLKYKNERKVKKIKYNSNTDGTGLKYAWEYKLFGELERKYRFTATPKSLNEITKEPVAYLDVQVAEMKTMEECDSDHDFTIVCFFVRKCAYLLYYESNP